MREKLGIIGFGNMGSAIAGQLKNDFRIYAFDKDKAKTAGIPGITAVETNNDLVSSCDNLLFAVKPQEFDGVLGEIKDSLSADKLIISIAAGISTGHIEGRLNIVRVIRAMPNILLKAGQAVTCLCAGRFAAEKDLEFAENLFGYMGEILTIKEEMMNAATAVSGSGPGYICYFIENGRIDPNNIHNPENESFLADFRKAAVNLGFSAQEAAFLADNTFKSTIGFLNKERFPAAKLREQVTSKGGTTEAALKALREGGSLNEALKAAVDRAEALSRST